MKPIFSDLTIVELSSVLAGPLVGTFFAEMGAKVIKIENKITGGDVTRGWKLKEENPESPISAYYASANFGKEIWKLNLNDATDMKRVFETLKTADVVIVNFRNDKAREFGIDYDSVKSLNPNVIYGLISGYGEEDERIAYDVVLQAETGYFSITGQSGGEAAKLPVAFIDVITAHQMKEGLLSALYRRERSGVGAFVHASLYDTAVSSLTNQASNYLMTGKVPGRLGTLHPNLSPYGEIFYSSENIQFVLAIGSESQFQSLCEMIGRPDLHQDEKFVSNQQRVVNRETLMTLLADVFKSNTIDHWLSAFAERHIPAGLVRNINEVMEDEQAKALILEEKIEGENTKRLKTVTFSIRD